ncbi:hypothetical protein P3X46_026964 [Hevea brasiliensis]|uniref:Uncharacterized protein n=1 Tax=Hevea brasiliensis TaxID=3981 RepID=A0ABQ9KYL2_HEVBR|nr:hypothetical protein P3X46_026964 [Hevea brasiliensis]
MGNNNLMSFLLCLVLVLLSFSRVENRPIHHFSHQRRITRSLIETAKEVLDESIRRQEMIGGFNESFRVSPGGPDPHHH